MNMKYSSVHPSVEYNMLLFPQITHYLVRENGLTNRESFKLFTIVWKDLWILFILRSCIEEHSHGPSNYFSKFRGESNNIQTLGKNIMVRKDIIGQRHTYILKSCPVISLVLHLWCFGGRDIDKMCKVSQIESFHQVYLYFYIFEKDDRWFPVSPIFSNIKISG